MLGKYVCELPVPDRFAHQAGTSRPPPNYCYLLTWILHGFLDEWWIHEILNDVAKLNIGICWLEE